MRYGRWHGDRDSTPARNWIALVTGGVRGIGFASALELARLGADIAIADIRLEAAAADATARIQALGREVCVIEADVGRTEDCRRLVAEAAAHFGALDVLVNNAGGGLGMYEEFEAVREEDYDRVLDVNLKGAFFTHRPWWFYNMLVTAQEYRVIDKIFFGTDFPIFGVAESIRGLRAANEVIGDSRLPRVSEETMERILHSNPFEHWWHDNPLS